MTSYRGRWERRSGGSRLRPAGSAAGLLVVSSAALATALPAGLAAQAEAAADSTRPHYRVTMGVGDDHWLRFGFERDIRPGWAVKTMVGVGLFTGVAALGPTARFTTDPRGELGVYLAGGKMTCSAFLDGPPPVCDPPTDEEAGWGFGAGVYWLYRFREDSQWSFGPTVAYWNRPASGEDRGFDIWTVGITVHKRFRGRARASGRQ